MNVASWTVDHVCQWLSQMGPAFAAYAAAVRENGVDGPALCHDVKADHDWALETWRSVRRETPELAALKGKTVIVRAT